jgi:uncharacterized protein (DUF736 family)
MSYQTKDGQGALFKNSYKETEQQPNMRGNLMINGVEWELSAWTKAKKDGEKYLSLSARPKVQKNAPAPEAAAGGGEPELDDELPF